MLDKIAKRYTDNEMAEKVQLDFAIISELLFSK
jgi:hypothetical protein